MFKKRKAYKLLDQVNLTDKNIKKELITPPSEQMQYDFNPEIENVRVMQQWIESKSVIKAENKIMLVKYLKGRFWKDVLWMMLAALVITIGYDYFIGSTGSTGLFSEGLSAFAKLFAVLTYPDKIQQQSSFYFIYYFAINVPLIIFSFWKMGTRFTLLTLLTMGLQIAFDQIIIRVPEINPESLYMIVDTQKLGGIPTEWNSTVWLFIKAICGGMLVGIGYGLPYRIGACSGGEDFVAIYISNKYEKSIGIVNRVCYFATFFVAIIVNTILLDPQFFNPDIKYGQVYESTNPQLWQNMMQYMQQGNHLGNFSSDAQTVFDAFKNIPLDANNEQFKAMVNAIVQGKSDVTTYAYNDFVQQIVRTDFNSFTTGEINKMRFLFIFGPGVFASCLLIVITTKFTDLVYPTHTVKTYLITSSKSEDVKNALINLGYRNDIIEWDADIQVQRHVADKEAILVTMTVSNWEEIEQDLYLVDPELKVNVIKTDKVKGKFDYHMRSDRELKQTWQILKQDKEWLKEIKDNSKQITKVKHPEYLNAIQEVKDKYTFKNIKSLSSIKTKEELDYWRRANLATLKNSHQRALLRLKHSWLVELSDSQRQKDSVNRWFNKTKKSFPKPDKIKIDSINKSYDEKLKQLQK